MGTCCYSIMPKAGGNQKRSERGADKCSDQNNRRRYQGSSSNVTESHALRIIVGIRFSISHSESLINSSSSLCRDLTSTAATPSSDRSSREWKSSFTWLAAIPSKASKSSNQSERRISPKSRHADTLHVIESNGDYPKENWLRHFADMPLRGFYLNIWASRR